MVDALKGNPTAQSGTREASAAQLVRFAAARGGAN